MNKKETELAENWYPAKKMKEHLDGLQEQIEARRESKVGDYHPLTLIEELQDEIFGTEGGEARWGERLKALYRWVERERHFFIEEGTFEELRKDLERQLDSLCCEADDKIEEVQEQVEDAVSIEDDLRPHGTVEVAFNDSDYAATPEDLKEIAGQAYELVRYLDGETAAFDFDALRFRLRRLGFWVAPVQQVPA